MGIFVAAVICTIAVLQIEGASLDLAGCLPNRQGVFTLTSTVDIYSPGFKEGVVYPDNLYCEWNVVRLFGPIKIVFEYLDVDVFDSCGKDMVQLHDGFNDQSPLIGAFCGDDKPRPFVTTSSSVFIRFRSDFISGRKGFHIRLEVFNSFIGLCPFGTSTCRNRNCFNSLSQRCNGIDDCGDGTDEENCNYAVAIPQCGINPITPRNATESDRIVGGTEAIPGSWPWQADLQLSFIYPNGHMCGGTLIHPQWVVTATHCFGGNRLPGHWRVHLGNHQKYKTDPHEQVRYASRIIVYPGTTGQELVRDPFNDNFQNDVALIKLNAPVTITDYVRTACMPSQGQELADGTNCMASGWGMTRGTGHHSELKQVELTIKPISFCNNIFIPVNPKTVICVKSPKGFQGVCHGDSGGPLACKVNNLWNVFGATSFGADLNYMSGLCALPNARTGYAKLSDKTNWIIEMIQRYNYIP